MYQANQCSNFTEGAREYYSILDPQGIFVGDNGLQVFHN